MFGKASQLFRLGNPPIGHALIFRSSRDYYVLPGGRELFACANIENFNKLNKLLEKTPWGVSCPKETCHKVTQSAMG